MKIEIRHRWNNSILFSFECGSVKEAVEEAVRQKANLSAANLSAAKNLRLPTGETLEDYRTKTVPALLTAGGKKLEEVANESVWKCHSWDNCPMAIAFDIHDPDKGPLLLRPRIKQFVQLYDARQIPLEKVLGKS